MQYLSDIREKSRQIDKMQGGLLMVLADIIESRDKCTGDHIRKTAEYSKIILNKLREKGEFADILTDEYINNVVRAAPLHDIGKINIPDAVLNKDSKLTDEEYEIMKGHAYAGYEIIEKAIANITEKLLGDKNLTIAKDKQGRYQFLLYSDNSMCLLMGESYPKRESAESALRSARNFIADAKLVE